MKKFFVFILAPLAVSLFLSSCQEEFDFGPGPTFQTESFDDFLWKKHTPDTIKAIINTKFDECEQLSKPMVLQLCNDDNEPIMPNVAQLYVNGQKSPDNTISIKPDKLTEKTEIWIVLNDSQIHETRTFTWYLQMVDNPGLVRVNEEAPEKTPRISDTTIHLMNKHVANSLRVGTDISLGTILSLLVAWILLAQLILFPKFKLTQIKKIFLMINGGRKNIQGYDQSVVGAKEIILTPEDKSQGFIKNLLLGKVVYIRIKDLPAEITLTPGEGRLQSKASYDKKAYESQTAGDNDELKVIKSLEGDYAVEYYSKRK